MMANRVRPGIEQTRPMSRTPNVRKAEWDLIRGNHQGQRQLRCIKQAGHKTAPDLMSKLQKILAMQEPSTQDIEACIRDVRFTPENGHGAKRLSAIVCVSGRYITAYAHIAAPSGSF